MPSKCTSIITSTALLLLLLCSPALPLHPKQGGPYHQTLHDILGAYACYRPDVGYVQGMSFLAGVLLLNMEAGDAFVCLANLLNRSSYLAFFRVDHDLMRPYFNTFKSLLQESLPRLSAHFTQLEFSPEYYLIEWSVLLMCACTVHAYTVHVYTVHVYTVHAYTVHVCTRLCTCVGTKCCVHRKINQRI